MTETITAPTWERVANIVVHAILVVTGVIVASVAWVPGSSAHGLVLVLGGGLAVAGVWLLVRAWRVAVVLTEDTLRVVGFFVTRTIPRAGITVVLDNAAVEWRDTAGREHTTGLWLFRPPYVDDGTVFARFWRWRRAGMVRVREWAHARSV